MQINFFILLFSLSFALINCGKPKSSHDNDSHQDNENNFNLTGNPQEAFTQWKNKLIKSCDSADAFSGPQSHDYHAIDGRVLLKQLDHSLLVKDPSSGAFLALGTPHSPSGSSHSTLEETGTNHSFKAEFKREGSLCEVWLSGQKVYETHLFNYLPVLVSQTEHVERMVTSTPLKMQTQQNLGYLDLQPWANLFFVNTPKEAQVLATVLNVSEKDIAPFLLSSNQDFQPHSISVPLLPEILAFDKSLPLASGQLASMEKFVSALPAYPLWLKIQAPQINVFDVSNDKDKGQLWVFTSRAFQRIRSADLSEHVMRPLRYEGTEPLNDQKAIDCFVKKTQAMLTANTANTESIDAYATMSACSALAQDFNQAVLTHAEAKNSLLAVLTKAQGSAHGWDELLEALAELTVAQRKNLKTELDPANTLERLTFISDFVDDFVEGLNKHPGLKIFQSDLIKAAVAMGFAKNSLSSQEIDHMTTCLANAVNPFQHAVSNFIDELTQGHLIDRESQTSFACSITANYKQLAKDIYLQAASIKADKWVLKKWQNVLVEQPSIETLQSWKQTLNVAQEFANRDRNRLAADDSRFLFDNALQSVVETALAEKWRQDEFATMEQIYAMQPYTIGCSMSKSVSQFASCKGFDLFSNHGDKILHSLYLNRYGILAQEWARYLARLDNTRSSLTYKLSSAFFRPVWIACWDDEFQRLRSELKPLIEEVIREKDFVKQFELERKIDALLERCRG